ncbi:MAG: EFR1 family ferrodoxin [Clostridia bacterium]|nr:EFR1 family ferrodoxin [Clostridia bacterium]
MSKTEIYYFSGTGNSLLVAKELQKRLPEAKLIPIVSLLKQDTIKVNGETAGFIFPLHGMTIPIPVRIFLKKLDLNSASYVFSLVTRAGTKCLALNSVNKILKRKGKCLDSGFTLTMLSNDPKFEDYDVPNSESISRMESEIRNKLDFVSGIITNREKYLKKDSDYIDFPFIKPVNFLLERIVLLGIFWADITRTNRYYYADSKCTGCGICEKVCLSGKIEMRAGEPLWRKNIKCYLCYTCLNYCPKQAVQIKSKIYMKSYTEKNGRYPHPFASVSDISGQK